MAVGEWDQRQLCPDGGCVGVIGPGGTCKVCGRVAQNWGDERKRGLIDPPEDDEDADEDEAEAADAEHIAANDDGDDEEDDDEDDEDEDDDDEDDGEDDEDGEDEDDEEDGPAAEHVVAASAAPVEWTSRELCADGTCIGVIGPSGRCKVCGRRAGDGLAPAPVAAAEPPAPARSEILSEVPGTGTPATAGPDGTAGSRCPDSACAGAIGPDGRCAVCGKVPA